MPLVLTLNQDSERNSRFVFFLKLSIDLYDTLETEFKELHLYNLTRAASLINRFKEASTKEQEIILEVNDVINLYSALFIVLHVLLYKIKNARELLDEPFTEDEEKQRKSMAKFILTYLDELSNQAIFRFEIDKRKKELENCFFTN